jgi:hypothetical protein
MAKYKKQFIVASEDFFNAQLEKNIKALDSLYHKKCDIDDDWAELIDDAQHIEIVSVTEALNPNLDESKNITYNTIKINNHTNVFVILNWNDSFQITKLVCYIK